MGNDIAQRVARLEATREKRLAENRCPNGCAGEMVFTSPFERHCEECGFLQTSPSKLRQRLEPPRL